MLRRMLCIALALALCAPGLAEDCELTQPFVEGVAPAQRNEWYGLVNEAGEVLIPLACAQVEMNEDGTGWVSESNGERRFRASDGRIEFYYEFPDGSEENLPDWTVDWAEVVPLDCAPKRYLGRYRQSRAGEDFALLDADGAVIQDDYMSFPYSSAVGAETYAIGWMLAMRDGWMGYLDWSGEWAIEPQFRNTNDFHDGLALVVTADRLYGFIDPEGNFAVEPVFAHAYEFQEGLAAVKVASDSDFGVWGYIRRDGSFAIEPQFDFALGFEGGLAVVQKDGRQGLIDPTGAAVIPLEYDLITQSSDGLFRAERDGRETLLRLNGGAVEEVREISSEISLDDYKPFTGAKVARLDGEPTLTERASRDYLQPRLDGATALFPVYAAFVEAVYPDKTRYGEEESDPLVTCTKTNRAYERLVEGKADMIFCAGPSDAQVEAARQAGLEFELTPFGREAFVFVVNADNPLEDLSIEQVREIYSGQITQWDELGAPGLGEIVAYQRPKDSGSQTALERLMGDVPIMDPPMDGVSDGMSEILDTIEYRNLPNAIGYSFRFFCTDMAGSDVKLLSLDGVSPTVENIRSGAYPQITTLYAVTRAGDPNPNVRALLDWITSPQGQELVEKSGYVGYTE